MNTFAVVIIAVILTLLCSWCGHSVGIDKVTLGDLLGIIGVTVALSINSLLIVIARNQVTCSQAQVKLLAGLARRATK